MEKREYALREALINNSEEVTRWEEYKRENESAMENLEIFTKRLTIDVMVPIGRKAFVPGQLVHTNEVLVGHYQNYFSKCSAHKAKEICKYRLQLSQEHLKQLMTEAELWENKLNKPYEEGVLPSPIEQEIIEAYEEETEQRWRQDHKVRVKEFKIREKNERLKAEEENYSKSSKGSTDDSILKMLEEAELLEELEKELDTLGVIEVNDEIVRNLMSGEMKLPEQKKRIAHKSENNVEVTSMHDGLGLPGIVKKSELNLNSSITHTRTNNNTSSNPEIDGSADSDDSSSEQEELPNEVKLIKEQAQFLPLVDQIGFYEYQIQIFKHKIQAVPLRNQQGVDEKIRMLSVLDDLEELLELAEEALGAEELAGNANDSNAHKEQEEQVKEKTQNTKEENEKQKEKRRISFALEDQTLEFRKNEAVAHLLPVKVDDANALCIMHGRDVICLDETKSTKSATLKVPQDKKLLINERVAQNLQFVEEHQSKQDFNLVDKILESVKGNAYTLHISFNHSDQIDPSLQAPKIIHKKEEEEGYVPSTPADCYAMYLKMTNCQGLPQTENIFVNGYEGEEHVKAPVLREAKRADAFESPRLQFSILNKELNPIEQSESTVTPISNKSILRNKGAVHNEKHKVNDRELHSLRNNKKNKKAIGAVNEEAYMSAYYKVMNDVVEKSETEPDPLPDGKYIDAFAPKKRISRFKQLRAGVSKF